PILGYSRISGRTGDEFYPVHRLRAAAASAFSLAGCQGQLAELERSSDFSWRDGVSSTHRGDSQSDSGPAAGWFSGDCSVSARGYPRSRDHAAAEQLSLLRVFHDHLAGAWRVAGDWTDLQRVASHDGVWRG